MANEIDKDGVLTNAKVTPKRFTSIEHGNIDAVHAIVVHQTDAPTATHTFNGYKAGGNGAHFLIDKDGVIYQTASVKKRCYHVGKLIKSKCLSVNGKDCKDPSLVKAKLLGWRAQIKQIDAIERAKSYPERYPVNSDSVGIELVGSSIDDKTYEAVTAAQNVSLQWLIDELDTAFSLGEGDVYRHPDVSYKNPGEAAAAKWKIN